MPEQVKPGETMYMPRQLATAKELEAERQRVRAILLKHRDEHQWVMDVAQIEKVTREIVG